MLRERWVHSSACCCEEVAARSNPAHSSGISTRDFCQWHAGAGLGGRRQLLKGEKAWKRQLGEGYCLFLISLCRFDLVQMLNLQYVSYVGYLCLVTF